LDVPVDITTDNNNSSHNVVVISPDDQNYKILLAGRDGINLPWVIHCDRASNQLLLTNEGDNTGVLYDISTTPI
jgi:hypothetical protein